MNAIGDVLVDLQDNENLLADELRAVSDRHRTEHEIHHVARDLENWSREHARRIAAIAPRYDRRAAGTVRAPARVLTGVREKVGEIVGRRAAPGLLLLRDLRTVYLMASDSSLHWEMLAQAAKARRDGDLLDLVSACHPQTLRQIRWANTSIKTLSPQILTSRTGR